MKMELPKDKPFSCKVDKNKPRIRRAANIGSSFAARRFKMADGVKPQWTAAICSVSPVSMFYFSFCNIYLTFYPIYDTILPR